ncbi:MAG: hypothetical protein II637_03230, partial [Bacteroidales bacterium]|nr:hypothetical protein [Bacteroidales bacterium]
MVKMCDILGDFKAVKSGDVWCTEQNMFQQSTGEADMIIDMSRIFSGKHFLGDVLAGFIVGAIFGILIGRATRFIINRFFKDSEGPSPSAETSNL